MFILLAHDGLDNHRMYVRFRSKYPSWKYKRRWLPPGMRRLLSDLKSNIREKKSLEKRKKTQIVFTINVKKGMFLYSYYDRYCC